MNGNTNEGRPDRDRAAAARKRMVSNIPAVPPPGEPVPSLQAILEALPDILFVVDCEGRIHHFNAPNSTRLYVPPEQFLGRRMKDVLPEPAAGIVDRAIQKAVEKGHHHGSIYSLPLPGGERWFEMSLSAQGDPKTPEGRLVAIVRDITARKHAEQDLRDSREYLVTVFNSIHDALIVHDAQTGAVLDVNQRLCEISGYTREEVLAHGMGPLCAGTPPYTLDDLVEWNRKACTAGPQHVEFLARHRDGHLVWVEVHIRRVQMGPNDLLLASVQDITQRKTAEAALRDSEQKYRMLTENMKDVVWVLDVEAQRFLYVSPSVTQLRGYTPEEILARPLAEAWAPAERERLAAFTAEAVRAFRAGEISTDTFVTYEMLQPCKDGAAVPSEVIAHLVRNPHTGRLEAHGVTREIQKRKRMETELRASEERFAQLARQSRTIVWEVDTKGLYTYINPVVEEVLGYRPDELIGIRHFYDWYPEESRETVKAAAFEIFRQKSALTRFENQIRSKDGRLRWLITDGFPLLDEDGQLRGYRGSAADITERKETEAALHASEERFAQNARQTRTFVWEVDNQGLYTFISPVVEDVLGYRPGEIVGKLHFYDLYPAEGREAYKQTILAAARDGGEFRNFENPMVAKDGRSVWVSTNAFPLRHADGSLRGYRGSDMDINRRKLTELALRESEARLRTLQDNLPNGLLYQMETGQDGSERRFTFVSQGVERLHGFTAAELLANSGIFYRQFLEEDLERVVADSARAVETQTPLVTEARMRLPSGEVRWRLFTSAPRRLLDGHLIWDGIELDITERKDAEKALRESEARFAAATQASRSYVWQVNPEGLITFISPMVTEVLGRRPEEIAGRLHFYDLLPEEDREEVKNFGLALMARREAISGFENRNVTQDGRLVWVSSSATPILDANGVYCGYQGIDTDITARKQAEEAFRESEGRLRAMQDNLPNGLVYQVDTGKDGTQRQMIYISKGVEQLHGVTAAEALQNAGVIYDQMLPEDRQQLIETEGRAIAALTSFRAETRVRLPSGEVRWRLFTSAPRRLPNGHLVWDGVELDITERKHAEEALRESEARLRTIQDNLPDGMVYQIVSGPNQEKAHYTYISQNVERMHGVTAPKMIADIGIMYRQILKEDQPPLAAEEARALATMTPFRCEVRVRLPSGEIRWRLFASAPRRLPNGDLAWDGLEVDITERKHAEEELKRSETKYRQLYESMRDPFASTDLKGNLLDFNPAFVDLLGYSRAELLRLNFRDITPRKWQAQERKIIREQVRKRGFSAVYEKEYVRKDGFVVPVELRTMLVCDASGKPTGMSAVIRDVSERRRAEQALKTSEAKYRQLHEWMQEAFVIADMEGRLVECNPAFEALIGYSQAEVARLHYADITPAKWRAVDARAVKRVLREGRSGVTEKEYIRKDGSLVPVEMTGTLIRDPSGRPTGISAIIRDITERKRAERELQQAHDELEQRVVERTAELESSRAALAQSEEQFRQMAESIADLFWLYEVKTRRMLYVSPAFEAIWGVSLQKTKITPQAWLATIHPDDRQRVRKLFTEADGIRAFPQMEYRILRPDGTFRWVSNRSWEIRDAAGKVYRIAGVVRDITDQRRMEAEILNAAEAERLRIGRDLHDSLGQALTGINYLTAALREELARKAQPEAAEVEKLGRLVGKAAEQAHGLARGLLLTDLKRGGLAAALQELALHTEELYGITCRYTGPAEIPLADGIVASHLYRITQEAITNAVKHSRAKTITVHLDHTGDGLLLSVKDTGRGLAQKKSGGGGLGLDIMHYRAGLIGATLWIDSTRNGGTTVNCLLPVSAAKRN